MYAKYLIIYWIVLFDILQIYNRDISILFNEFGVSVVSFSYLPAKKKIKLLSVLDKMDRWYIKRILKRDLLRLMEVMEASGSSYFNSKYNIKYTFTPLIYDDAIEE